MRLVIYQYGDYAEAALRFAEGGKETYYAQKYSVDYVAKLVDQVEDLTVISFARDRSEMRLPSGVRCIGLELYPQRRRSRHLDVIRTISRLRPDHLVVTSPQPWVIAWALARGVRTLPMFADSFDVKGARAKVRFAVLARLLNSKRIDWVSNHNLAASLDLVRIGVAQDKVVPFDWPAFERPGDRPPKQPRGGDEFTIMYVGLVTEAKGVSDLIEALRLLNAAGGGPRWRATIVGGHDCSMEKLAEQSGVGHLIKFAGRVPHDDVVPLMNQHDAVVVPSRHEYPEGLPMTIYEGICSRTPLVVSDHPMFRLKLRDEVTALVFRAGDPASFAERLHRLQSDPELYVKLSRNAEAAAEQFFCPLKYHELIGHWLSGRAEDRQVLSQFTIATGRYNREVGAA
jgi:glycosyltransferase involved in cell wall biosynthesis